MANAIGYVRVSTDGQNLRRQIELIKEYCLIKELDLVKIIGDKESGAKAERKGYVEVMTLTKEDADIIIMTEVSRLSREEDIMQPMSVVNNLLREGIDVAFLDNNVNTERIIEGGHTLSLIQIITLAVELDAAAKERKKIVGRMHTGKKVIKASFDNAYLGGMHPFGYDKVVNPNYEPHKTPKTILVRNEEKAELVRKIFAWAIEGNSGRIIANKLNELGVRTNFNKEWINVSVHQIVRNTLYKGEWVFSNKVYEGDAIVTEDIWNAANAALKANKLPQFKNGNKNKNILRGLLKCACGHSLIIDKRKDGSRTYRCTSTAASNRIRKCGYKGVSVDMVQDAVWNAVKCANTPIYTEANRNRMNETNKAIESIIEKLEGIDVQMQHINRQMDNIVNNLTKVTTDIIINKLNDRFVECERRLNELATIKENENKRLIEYKKLLEVTQTSNIVVNKELTEDEKEEIYNTYIDKIVYYGKKVKFRGFLVIYFKNGLEIKYLLMSAKHKVIQLPHAWQFNKDTEKMVVTFMPRRKFGDFRLDTYTEEFNEIDIENIFPDIIEENNIYRLDEEFN